MMMMILLFLGVAGAILVAGLCRAGAMEPAPQDSLDGVQQGEAAY